MTFDLQHSMSDRECLCYLTWTATTMRPHTHMLSGGDLRFVSCPDDSNPALGGYKRMEPGRHECIWQVRKAQSMRELLIA